MIVSVFDRHDRTKRATPEPVCKYKEGSGNDRK